MPEVDKYTREELIDIFGGQPGGMPKAVISVKVQVLASMVWHLHRQVEELEQEVKWLKEVK